ncbi:NAD(P)/FAD-dependent oxidoreductase [Sphingomonas sp. CARO-RG-8B-R24-01]|uniref:NAD(P)/FAD-dependent oxidoreductase n=1 Tax=Sphingomonas sp. CARO-RG-8B-R24-01 TaxID=2914831 RepID=UPI001F562175|nr:NAD(P)/FAD-dependent oxidoreductase [Sphingomonas sp. CARO-RG-8B-R24-01]
MKILDPHAIDGKFPAPDEQFDLIVVGAGRAGTTTAIRAALSGASVLLIDENPVAGAVIGNDVPLFFGGRATAAVHHPDRLVEQLFRANPELEAAFDAGVDVRLGTVAWGLYVPNAALRALPGPLLGIADAEASRMVGFRRLVLATGARDIAMAFPGWDQPGVMGAQGFAALLTRYDALASQRIVIIGSGDLALQTARLALERGIAVAGIVEIADRTEVDPALAEALGVPVFLAYTIAATDGGIDGVERVTLASLTDDATRTTLECDAIVLAIGVTPATELIEAAGTVANGLVQLVGDSATVQAPADGRLLAWASALGRHAPPKTIVCQCEAVTRADLLGVQPPRYLDRPARLATRSLGTLLADGPAHPDQIKRLTRAGMGPCQGRRCREQVRCLLAVEQGVLPSEVPVASFRAPVRPVPLSVLADWNEDAGMTAGWDVWFGIPTQWTPYAAIGTPEEAEHVTGLGGTLHV